MLCKEARDAHRDRLVSPIVANRPRDGLRERGRFMPPTPAFGGTVGRAYDDIPLGAAQLAAGSLDTAWGSLSPLGCCGRSPSLHGFTLRLDDLDGKLIGARRAYCYSWF